MASAASTESVVFAGWQFSDTRVLQRAHLTVVPRGVDLFKSADGRLSCDVGFLNVGHMAAENVSWWMDRKFCTNPRLQDVDFPIPDDKLDGNNLIPPGIQMRKGAPHINSAELDAFRHNNQSAVDGCWLYVWGRVRYTDGFKNRRHTDFCYRYSIAGKSWTISGDDARQHERGNRTDQNPA